VNAGLEADEHLLNLAEAKRQWVMREGELDARVEELEVERDELLDRTEELTAMVDDEKSLLEQFENNFKKEYKEWEDQLAAKDSELLERMEQNELLLLKINRLNSDLGDGNHHDTLAGLTAQSAGKQRRHPSIRRLLLSNSNTGQLRRPKLFQLTRPRDVPSSTWVCWGRGCAAAASLLTMVRVGCGPGAGTPAEAEALRVELRTVNEKAVVLADAYCALEQVCATATALWSVVFRCSESRHLESRPKTAARLDLEVSAGRVSASPKPTRLQDTAREVEAALEKQGVRLARLEEDNVKLRAALDAEKKSEARSEKVKPPPSSMTARMRERHRGGKRRAPEHRRTAGGRTSLYAWPFPREGRCLGWLGVSVVSTRLAGYPSREAAPLTRGVRRLRFADDGPRAGGPGGVREAPRGLRGGRVRPAGGNARHQAAEERAARGGGAPAAGHPQDQRLQRAGEQREESRVRQRHEPERERGCGVKRRHQQQGIRKINDYSEQVSRERRVG
jgi:hypothetical protein